jgi:hypothetical protein
MVREVLIMAWDSVKVDGVSSLPASEYNDMVTDQKTRLVSADIANMVKVKVVPYSGNGAQNRDIAHTCGTTPFLVLILGSGGLGMAFWSSVKTTGMRVDSANVVADNYNILAVGATNVRVGANATGDNYNLSGSTYVMMSFYL